MGRIAAVDSAGVVIRRRRIAVRRVHLDFAERDELARSGLLATPGGLEAVLVFDDGGPSYAARLPRPLAWFVTRWLERAMTALEPLLVEDLEARRAGARR